MSGLIIPNKDVLTRLRRLGLSPYSPSAARLLIVACLFIFSDFLFQAAHLPAFFAAVKSCAAAGLDYQKCAMLPGVFFEGFLLAVGIVLGVMFLAWLINWGVQQRFLFAASPLALSNLQQSVFLKIICLLGNFLALLLLGYLSFQFFQIGLEKLFMPSIRADFDLFLSVEAFFITVKSFVLISALAFFVIHHAAAWLRFFYEITALPEELTKTQQQGVNKISF